MLLVLEHSFQLHQEGVHQPFSLAKKKLNVLDLHAGVEKATNEVFEQYDKVSQDQKVDMVTNLIFQNHLYVWNIFSSILFVNSIMQRPHQPSSSNGGKVKREDGQNNTEIILKAMDCFSCISDYENIIFTYAYIVLSMISFHDSGNDTNTIES